LKKILKSYLMLFIIAGVIIALDQWSKHLLLANLALGETWSPWPWLAPYARIVHWYNTGVAFGMFQGQNWLFLILALLVSAGIIYYFPRVPASETTLRIALSMQLGGALGNAIDRIRFGYVIDFISVGDFPVWNVADASITVGVGVLLLGIWLQERHLKKIEREEQNPVSQIDDRPGE
jgi:signal peptidase II